MTAKSDTMSKRGFLDGQMLIAMPSMGDPRFSQTVIYLCAHSDNGAMGLIVNKATPMMSFADLISQIELHGDLPQRQDGLLDQPVLYGGPVEPARGFVLHTSDYFAKDSSLPVTEHVALTATTDILVAMVKGKGPKRAAITLGYSGWAPGQLENEIQHNGWLHCAADDELLFGAAHDEKYAKALRKIGVDPAMLSNDAGHA